MFLVEFGVFLSPECCLFFISENKLLMFTGVVVGVMSDVLSGVCCVFCEPF